MLLNGQWVSPQPGKSFAVTNPATGDVIADVADGGPPLGTKAATLGADVADAAPPMGTRNGIIGSGVAGGGDHSSHDAAHCNADDEAAGVDSASHHVHKLLVSNSSTKSAVTLPCYLFLKLAETPLCDQGGLRPQVAHHE